MNSFQNKAVRITEQVLASLKIKPGQTEAEVARSILKKIKSLGGQKEAFRTIVASGKRSSLVHGFSTGKRIRPGEIVMIDFGVLYREYRSDITRTFILGKMSRMQNKIYRLVLKAQKAALSVIREGVECREVDLAAREVIRKAGFGNYFRHTTGHGIGMKVHQAPKLSRRNRNRLKAGQVITVEPGIYLKHWGIRIEDMVMVTKKGYQLLTKVPK